MARGGGGVLQGRASLVLLAWLALTLPPVNALAAGVQLVDSVPEDGARLDAPPAQLEIRLSEPVRLSHFVVSGPGGMVALSESPEGQLGEHHRAVPAEPLAPGEHRIAWRGMAGGGTETAGGYRFEIAP
ncbi:copper resistance CopC family protein [Halomonas sp. E14]|uniref:copper resistance CopC family protein n=2 Tax=unclassified Halomonas TaxID=2609666 RepID=UPI00403EE783